MPVLFSEVALVSLLDIDPLASGNESMAEPIRSFGRAFRCEDAMERYLGALSAMRRGDVDTNKAKRDMAAALRDMARTVAAAPMHSLLATLFDTYAVALERRDTTSSVYCAVLIMRLLHPEASKARLRDASSRPCLTCLSGTAHVSCSMCNTAMYCSHVCASVDMLDGHGEHVCELAKSATACAQPIASTIERTMHIAHGTRSNRCVAASDAAAILRGGKTPDGRELTSAQRRFFDWAQQQYC